MYEKWQKSCSCWLKGKLWRKKAFIFDYCTRQNKSPLNTFCSIAKLLHLLESIGGKFGLNQPFTNNCKNTVQQFGPYENKERGRVSQSSFSVDLWKVSCDCFSKGVLAHTALLTCLWREEQAQKITRLRPVSLLGCWSYYHESTSGMHHKQCNNIPFHNQYNFLFVFSAGLAA